MIYGTVEASASAESMRLVNKTGFPLQDNVVQRMWERVDRKYGHPLVMRLRNSDTISPIPIPQVPILHTNHSLQAKLYSIQQYISQLQYNHTGMQFFEIKKNRPLSRLIESAKEIIRESLPIKCLEAVIVAIYLTSPLSEVQRFAISFKSQFKSKIHRHVVLGIHHHGIIGALGLSRRIELMYKPLKYTSLFELISNFDDAYQKCGHKLLMVRLSGSIPHENFSCEEIKWKEFSINWDSARIREDSSLEKYMRRIRQY